MLEVTGSAKFKIIEETENGDIEEIEVKIDNSELEINLETSDSRQMGDELGYLITLNNDKVEAEWHAYEYPIGSLNHVEVISCSADEIIEDFKFNCTIE